MASRFVVGIDPAFGGTGIAMFGRTGKLVAVSLLKKIGKDPFEERASFLACETLNVIGGGYKVPVGGTIHVYCEIPAYHGTPSRSMGWIKGDLQKLTYLVGAIGHEIISHGYGFHTCTTMNWKGQLSKKLVTDRIRKRISDVDSRFHPKADMWDAIGIGMWALGRF